MWRQRAVSKCHASLHEIDKSIPFCFLSRTSVILEAWDSDSKAGYFPGITFKALRLCSTMRPNFTAAQQKLAAAGASVPPALMVRACLP
jgi:hypothetical protein